jgi:hypothetical protein
VPTRSLAVLVAVMVCLCIVLAVMVWVFDPSASTHSTGLGAESCATRTVATPDFDDDGEAPDLAVGIPGEDLGTQPDAGAVEVRYAEGAPQILYPEGYRAGDRFGASVVTTFVNDDECSDLLVGAPGQDVADVADAGAVHIYLGSDTGLGYWRTLVQGSDGVPGQAQGGARFGEGLASGGYGLSPARPHPERLYVGTPGLDVGSVTDAGGVVELTMTVASDGVDIEGVQLTQDSPGVPEQAEVGDRWGAPVIGRTERFAAAAVGESVGDVPRAGAVIHRGWSEGYELLTQDTPGVAGSAEAGDEFGAAIFALNDGRLWVGVPGEDLGETIDAGMAVAVSYDYGGVQDHEIGVTQSMFGFAGSAEAGDRFGSAITSFLPYYEDESDRQYPVQVGVPGEDIGTVRDAGMVNSFALLSDSPESARIAADGRSIDQGATAGKVEPGDRFGATLATFDSFYAEDPQYTPWEYRALYVIGAPGEDSGAGSVVRVQYVSDQLRSRIWKQETGAREAGDGFGTAIVQEVMMSG